MPPSSAEDSYWRKRSRLVGTWERLVLVFCPDKFHSLAAFFANNAHLDRRTGELYARPGHELTALVLGKSNRTVQRKISDLGKLGWLRSQAQVTGPGIAQTYLLEIPTYVAKQTSEIANSLKPGMWRMLIDARDALDEKGLNGNESEENNGLDSSTDDLMTDWRNRFGVGFVERFLNDKGSSPPKPDKDRAPE